MGTEGIDIKEMEAKIINIISEQMGVDKSEIARETSFINDLKTVDSTMALWVKFDSLGDGFFTINGTRPDSTVIVLKKGWNFVGYPSWKLGVTVQTSMAGVSFDLMQTFSPIRTYNLRDVPSTEMLNPGMGYWVHVSSESTWVVAG